MSKPGKVIVLDSIPLEVRKWLIEQYRCFTFLGFDHKGAAVCYQLSNNQMDNKALIQLLRESADRVNPVNVEISADYSNPED